MIDSQVAVLVIQAPTLAQETKKRNKLLKSLLEEEIIKYRFSQHYHPLLHMNTTHTDMHVHIYRYTQDEYLAINPSSTEQRTTASIYTR